MAARQRLQSQLIGLWLYVLRKLSRRRQRVVPSVYLAFSIGPEALAVRVNELDVRSDEDALEKATPLFHHGLLRIEVWCGSRKVGDIPPQADEKSNGENKARSDLTTAPPAPGSSRASSDYSP
jgi:hypothetical protein